MPEEAPVMNQVDGVLFFMRISLTDAGRHRPREYPGVDPGPGYVLRAPARVGPP